MTYAVEIRPFSVVNELVEKANQVLYILREACLRPFMILLNLMIVFSELVEKVIRDIINFFRSSNNIHKVYPQQVEEAKEVNLIKDEQGLSLVHSEQINKYLNTKKSSVNL